MVASDNISEISPECLSEPGNRLILIGVVTLVDDELNSEWTMSIKRKPVFSNGDLNNEMKSSVPVFP